MRDARKNEKHLKLSRRTKNNLFSALIGIA
jgi:hypothetical protein